MLARAVAVAAAIFPSFNAAFSSGRLLSKPPPEPLERPSLHRAFGRFTDLGVAQIPRAALMVVSILVTSMQVACWSEEPTPNPTLIANIEKIYFSTPTPSAPRLVAGDNNRAFNQFLALRNRGNELVGDCPDPRQGECWGRRTEAAHTWVEEAKAFCKTYGRFHNSIEGGTYVQSAICPNGTDNHIQQVYRGYVLEGPEDRRRLELGPLEPLR